MYGSLRLSLCPNKIGLIPVRPQCACQCAPRRRQCVRESAAAVRPPRVTPVCPPVRPPGCLLSSTVCLCRKQKQIAMRRRNAECSSAGTSAPLSVPLVPEAKGGTGQKSCQN